MEKNLLLTELVEIAEGLADAVADYVHEIVDGEDQADVDG